MAPVMDSVIAMLATQAINIAGCRPRVRKARTSTRLVPMDERPPLGLVLIRRSAPKAAPATAMTAPARYAAG